MWLATIPVLVWLVVALCEELSPVSSPCDDYHSYICSKDLAPRVGRFPDIRTQTLSTDIDQYQEYVFPTTEPAKRLWEVVDPDVVSLWLVQFTTFVDGPNWLSHQQRHEKTMKMTNEQKFKALELYTNMECTPSVVLGLGRVHAEMIDPHEV